MEEWLAFGGDSQIPQAVFTSASANRSIRATFLTGCDVILETAHLTGDGTLLKAASLSEYNNGWNRAVNRYSEIASDAGRRSTLP